MAWFGDGLSSLSNLKGQITNFTKEVLSEGIVNEIDDRSRQLEEANEKCVELQELLNTKDAEIALLRRHNCELQKTVVELNVRVNEVQDANRDDEGGGFFWDPQPPKNREHKGNRLQIRELQDKLIQSNLRLQELEAELENCKKKLDKSDQDAGDGHQKAELLRAKQDIVNRIIQIGEKGREAEKNIKKLQLDETTFVNDFRAAISKLDSHEQTHLIRCALKALEVDRNEKETDSKDNEEKSNGIGKRKNAISQKIYSEDTANTNGFHNREADLLDKIQKLQEENKSLTCSIEELDQQHAQSIEKILTLKEQLQKKHQHLQSAYESLYVDYTTTQEKLTLLETELSNTKSSPKGETKNSINDPSSHANSNVPENTNDTTADSLPIINDNNDSPKTIHLQDKSIDVNLSLSNENKLIQTELEDQKLILENLTKRVTDLTKNCNIQLDNESNENIFEAMAKKLVDTQWKKDALERKISELMNELKQSNEEKESLHLECDDLQHHIEALDLELQHMKSNLPSIPEESEDKVASQEAEIESMAQEIKRLQGENDSLSHKNSELITALSNIEGSLRNQENLEAEVRNTKQQLEIARQQLAGASKNVENNENMMEDLSRRLHAALDENNELRDKNDALNARERQMTEQVSVYEAKCKSLNENIELIEELKLDINNVKKELLNSQEKAKQLENELALVYDAKKEIERDILALSQENEQLEMELTIIKQHETINEDNNLVKELRNQVETITREKDDLEYDLMNMRKELDSALSQMNTAEEEYEKMKAENDKLVSQTPIIDELKEKIEISQTEFNALQQEHVFLQEEVATEKAELVELKAKLIESKEKCENLQQILTESEHQKQTLEEKNEKMLRKLETAENFEEQLTIFREKCGILEQRLEENEHQKQTLKEDNEKLQNQLEIVGDFEPQVKKLQEQLSIYENKCQNLNEQLINSQSNNKEAKIYKEKCQQFQAELKNLENSREKLEELIERNRNLEEEMFALKAQNLKLSELQATIEVKNSSIEELKIHVSQLQSKVGESEAKLRDQEAEFKEQLNKTQSLEEKCVKLEEELKRKMLENERLIEKSSTIGDLNVNQVEIDALVLEKNRLSESLVKNQEELTATIEKSKEAQQMAKETIENLSEIIKKKDGEIEEMNKIKSTVVEYEKRITENEAVLTSLKAERDELVKLVQAKHNESVQYHAEIQRMTQLFNEQVATLQSAVSEREAAEKIVKEKEAEILWAQNELQVVKQRLKNLEESTNYGETCNVVEHSTKLAQWTILNEKCNALEEALVKEQSSNRILQNQLSESQKREITATKNLERLQSHLVEIEASHTEEALILEQSKKELEAKLVQAEEVLKNSSTVYTSASIRANQQVETLQQQMALIVQQRDEIQSKLSAAEDKVLAHTASLTNLQIVLEQFQRDKENDIRDATEKIRQQLNDSYKKQEELNAEIASLKHQLTEAKGCLQAASRLSEQIEKKTGRIQELNEEVARLTELVNTAEERIQKAKESGEGKVDKNLMKNLLLGFLSASPSDKMSVLKVFATVLDFNESEREKSGLNSSNAHGGWFSGLLSSGGNAPTKDQEASLSAAFIRFLENESKPISSIPALPISNTQIPRPGHSRQHSTSSNQSGLLLTNVTLPSFPDFVPSRNTGSILKEVLKDS